MEVALVIVLFLISVSFHEAAHGFAAYRLGDPTAKESGRLSLNPLRHIDPFWTVLMPVVIFWSTQGRFAFGKAKPVPVDFSRLHHPKRDMIWVALAGPAANFLMAGIFRALWSLKSWDLFLFAVYLNLGLALFNLFPVPPLDGSKVLAGLLPLKAAVLYLKTERFGFWLILVLYVTGLISFVLMPVLTFFCRIYRVPALMG